MKLDRESMAGFPAEEARVGGRSVMRIHIFRRSIGRIAQSDARKSKTPKEAPPARKALRWTFTARTRSSAFRLSTFATPIASNALSEASAKIASAIKAPRRSHDWEGHHLRNQITLFWRGRRIIPRTVMMAHLLFGDVRIFNPKSLTKKYIGGI